MTPVGRWMVLAVAAIAGMAFAFITPPFEVSDELIHYYRPVVIAQGQLLLQRRGAPDAAMVPVGVKTLVYVMLTERSGDHYTSRQMRLASQIPLQPDIQKQVR